MVCAYGFSKFKRRSVQRLPRLASARRLSFRCGPGIKSSTRSGMHIYTHIPQRIIRPRVIYRAGTPASIYTYIYTLHISRNFPTRVSARPTVRARSLFLPFILFWKGVRVFPLSTVIPSCQIRETAWYLSLAECARLFSRGCLHSVTSFPNVPLPLPSLPPPPRPRIRPTQVGLTLARHRLAYR